jgi:hypothetical protein
VKIVCTAAEKEWLIPLMAESESCLIKAKCIPQCPECLQKSIEWVIIEDGKHTCCECAHFIGGGDWNLCCDLPHPECPYGHLCYEWTEACDSFRRKE